MIERDFYPLPMLAERWGCTVHDILHLGIQDRAQVCVNIYGMTREISQTRMDTDPPDVAPDDMPLTENEQCEAEALDAAFECWKSRTTKEMPVGVFELGRDDLRFLDMPSAFPYGLHEALKFNGGWWACEFDPPVSINLDHLCMLHEEVQRLDREVFAAGAQVGQLQDENARVETESSSRAYWPWGGHSTRLLGHMDAAARRFWVNYDPGDNTTAPRNEDVSGWLQSERGLSASISSAIASILRADDLPTGPRK